MGILEFIFCWSEVLMGWELHLWLVSEVRVSVRVVLWRTEPFFYGVCTDSEGLASEVDCYVRQLGLKRDNVTMRFGFLKLPLISAAKNRAVARAFLGEQCPEAHAHLFCAASPEQLKAEWNQDKVCLL